MKRKLVILATLVAMLSAVFMPGVAAAQGTGLLTNIPVSGTLSDGGTFVGNLTITALQFVDGQLRATGTLTGTATSATGTVTQITQAFSGVVTGLLGGGGRCEILELDLGPLNLDLLGLQVDLSAIDLDVTAVRGPGRLLGNLLCAVAGLLDTGGPLDGILGLLNQINRILG